MAFSLVHGTSRIGVDVSGVLVGVGVGVVVGVLVDVPVAVGSCVWVGSGSRVPVGATLGGPRVFVAAGAHVFVAVAVRVGEPVGAHPVSIPPTPITHSTTTYHGYHHLFFRLFHDCTTISGASASQMPGIGSK